MCCAVQAEGVQLNLVPKRKVAPFSILSYAKFHLVRLYINFECTRVFSNFLNEFVGRIIFTADIAAKLCG